MNDIDLARNPFMFSKPILDPQYFVGRKDLLARLRKAMAGVKSDNVSILGEKGTGKTSLLQYLANPNTAFAAAMTPNHIQVYFSFEEFRGMQEAKLWASIAESIAEQLEQKYHLDSKRFLETINKSSSLPNIGFERAFQQLDDDGWVVHLLLDDFDQVLENQVTEKFFKVLRGLSRLRNVSFVIASELSLSDIETRRPKPHDPLTFNSIFAVERLVPFQESEAHALIHDYLSQSGFTDIDEQLWSIKDQIKDYTGYHPCLLQMLCYHFIRLLDEPGWPMEQAFDLAVESFYKDSQPLFLRYWTNSTPEEQDLLQQIVENRSLDWDQLTTEVIVRRLRNRSLVIPTEDHVHEAHLISSSFGQWIAGGREQREHQHESVMDVITGAKGGVGKTLLSICLAVSYLEKGRTLLVDLNWENPDMSRIMRLNQKSTLSGDFQSARICDGQGLVMGLRQPHTLPKAALGFWDIVRQVLQVSRTEYDFDPQYIVVDTCLHFASSIRQTNSGTMSRVTQRIDSLAVENKIQQINMWYVWTFASFMNDLADIAAVLGFYDKQLRNMGHFDAARNFVHVLNPHSLVSKTSPGFEKQEIYSFRTMLDAKVGDGIAFDPFVTSVVKTIERNPLKSDKKEKHRRSAGYLSEAVGNDLLELFNSKRPSNVFPIPYYDPEVATLTDGFSEDTAQNIVDMKKKINLLLECVEKYREMNMTLASQ